MLAFEIVSLYFHGMELLTDADLKAYGNNPEAVQREVDHYDHLFRAIDLKNNARSTSMFAPIQERESAMALNVSPIVGFSYVIGHTRRNLAALIQSAEVLRMTSFEDRLDILKAEGGGARIISLNEEGDTGYLSYLMKGFSDVLTVTYANPIDPNKPIENFIVGEQAAYGITPSQEGAHQKILLGYGNTVISSYKNRFNTIYDLLDNTYVPPEPPKRRWWRKVWPMA